MDMGTSGHVPVSSLLSPRLQYVIVTDVTLWPSSWSREHEATLGSFGFCGTEHIEQYGPILAFYRYGFTGSTACLRRRIRPNVNNQDACYHRVGSGFFAKGTST